MMRPREASRFYCGVLGLACLACACGTAPKRSSMISQVEEVQVAESKLRMLLYNYVFEFTQAVESTANDIAREKADDPVIYRSALQWKLGAGTQARRAAFHPDVLVGFMDAWALAEQQRDFFTQGKGAALFGAQQSLAVATADRLAGKAQELALHAADEQGVSRGETHVRRWASQHAIESIRFERSSIAPDLVVRYHRSGGHGVQQSLANMEDLLDDVVQRLTLYSERTPREVLWESQLMVGDMLRHPSLTQSFEDLRKTQAAVTDMVGFVDALPLLIEDQRRATFDDIKREREATLAVLQEERALILAALHQERLAVMGDVRQMYDGSLHALREERAAAFDQLPETVARTVSESDEVMRSLVDHVFLRTAQLLAVGGAIGAIAWFGVVFWRRRER